ncbi:NADH:ubiquinone reductase (Na(+)-transporting) subunit F [Frigidibacter sp. ROC022]|uniref:NADH:ubiquinone reductase (Na(+)-transporting) subunit F n=1 Tax=Frigidibacter sp. ROC022 TaxID=2971796 RepID=UPI00215AE9AA|nr:NADH:ubiquinone reductase (Na(+)-transporting) subunit F [Frigidibacter sp. ROC022]MCR8725535.1 NADH:ubiquinone reductase (Na(+)-transporting) subunit F [Frigidibacter sp. ROC022]
MTEALLGSAVFVGIVLMLVVLVLLARMALLPRGTVTIRLNQRSEITAPKGSRLINALAEAGVALPAACGGNGTCGQCRLKITEGSGPALPTEEALLSRQEIASGMRLACQTTLRSDLAVSVPESLLSAQSYACTVRSTRSVAPLIREIVLALPEGSDFSFTPGAFVMTEAPPYRMRFADVSVAPEHVEAWKQMGLPALTSESSETVARAYSIASNALEPADQITLLIRLAVPPPSPPGLPPGVVSSWLFGLKPGDAVPVKGPYGSIAAQDNDREMVFIGGGVGMAPLRAIISDQLLRQKTTRKMSFWYGARSKVDLFYQEEFDRLQAEHPNFHWTAALSDPAPGDDWQGATGFVHEVAHRLYLAEHPAPQDCDYFLCGPPLMIRAVLNMLDALGVDPERIFNDDFGG